MNMGTHEFRNKVKEYTEKAIKDLEEVKKISDTEQQSSEISSYVRNHKQKLEELKQGKPDEIPYSDHYLPHSLEKYEKKVKELDDYWGEIADKSNKIREQKIKEQHDKEHELRTSYCAYCKSEPPTEHFIYNEKNKNLKSRKRNAYKYKREWLFCSESHFEKWHKKNYFTCAECLKEKWDGKHKYHKTKKDNQKFCSDNCFYTHYAEKCDSCWEKCISSYQGKATGFAQTYYSDGINKTGTLCSKCHDEKLKEEAEESKKDKEWEETWKRIDKNMDDLVDGMVEVAKGKEDEDLDNSEINDKNKEIEDNKLISIERERDQIQSQQSQLLSQIHQLESNPTKNQSELNSKKQQLAELQTKEKTLIKSLPLNTQINLLEKEIKDLEKKTNKSQTEHSLSDNKKKELEELLKKQSNSNANNAKPNDRTGLYISCGVVGIFALLLILVLARNRRKGKVKHY